VCVLEGGRWLVYLSLKIGRESAFEVEVGNAQLILNRSKIPLQIVFLPSLLLLLSKEEFLEENLGDSKQNEKTQIHQHSNHPTKLPYQTSHTTILPFSDGRKEKRKKEETKNLPTGKQLSEVFSSDHLFVCLFVCLFYKRARMSDHL
jgi:hypothetical protein